MRNKCFSVNCYPQRIALVQLPPLKYSLKFISTLADKIGDDSEEKDNHTVIQNKPSEDDVEAVNRQK